MEQGGLTNATKITKITEIAKMAKVTNLISAKIFANNQRLIIR